MSTKGHGTLRDATYFERATRGFLPGEVVSDNPGDRPRLADEGVADVRAARGAMQGSGNDSPGSRSTGVDERAAERAIEGELPNLTASAQDRASPASCLGEWW